MATKTTKAAAKANAKPVKKNAPVKKAVTAKSSVATKKSEKTAVKKAAPAKQAVKGKAAPVKKSAPAKVAPKAPAEKKGVAVKAKTAVKSATPAKKAQQMKKGTTENTKPTKEVTTKKAAKEVVAEPVKKVAAKKEAPVKEEVAKKAAVKAEPAKKSAKESAPAKKSVAELPRKVISAKSLQAAPTPRPTATPAARPTEKKPQVIVAHRKLENKSKPVQEESTDLPYKTEVYRSILDEPAPAPVTVYRYSDEELAEFKELITNRLEAARKELVYLQGVITRKDEAGTEDTENRYMNMEDGSGAMEREQLAQLASRQIQFMNHLEKALVRIENKTYGICRVTGKLIDKARLRAVPHATLSIEAKKMMNTKQN